MGEDIEMTVCDFWPKWHTAGGKMLGTGHTVWYQNNRVMPVRKRHTAYAVYDPAAGGVAAVEGIGDARRPAVRQRRGRLYATF